MWLNPVQLDLLRPVPAPDSNRLCGMIVVTAANRFGDPTVPAFVGLGIPRADLSEWVRLVPLHELLSYAVNGNGVANPLNGRQAAHVIDMKVEGHAEISEGLAGLVMKEVEFIGDELVETAATER